MKRTSHRAAKLLRDTTPQTVHLERIVGGGQTMGVLQDGTIAGKKIFVWGGLPGETVLATITKQKAGFAEGVVTEVVEPAAAGQTERIVPRDPESYLSTSPWQIMDFASEQRHKAQLISEAFAMHQLTLPAESIDLYSDEVQFGYRNKVEFSWWWQNPEDDAGQGQLDLAFFKRGSHGKQPVEGTSLARDEINALAQAVRDLLRAKGVEARSLKTLLIRCDQNGQCVWQLYVKDKLPDLIADQEAAALPAAGGEIIYSDPQSPASRISERLVKFGDITLRDDILQTPFSYAAESFFQVNLPVYEQALRDMQPWISQRPTVDLYSGVGSIGLAIGNRGAGKLSLVEIDQHAFQEMERNIAEQGRQADVQAVLAPSEKALDCITGEADIIVDPPRAGLHAAVTERLLATLPLRIIYLSCNPVTQARDVSLLQARYRIKYTRGYNFFPRTPHIEHLVVLERHSD